MEWTLSYILSQVFSLLCFVCFGITFFSKKQKNIRLLGILMNVSQAISYMFLSEPSGWAMLIIAIIRNVVFFKLNKKEYTTSYKLILLILMLSIGVVGAISYKDIYSLLPIFAMALYSVAVWQKSPKIYKLLAIPNCVLWIAYNIAIFSLVAIVGESIMLVLAIIGYISEIKKPSLETTDKKKI